ncbi:MAG: hypothetical protein GY938_19190, partial [Ketobacter sp.]|nr:hypothetical protein [Ketobacter sp.]
MTITYTDIQVEVVTGRTDQRPSEYQLVDATHDGIACYNTANGNIVTSTNEIIDSTGATFNEYLYGRTERAGGLITAFDEGDWATGSDGDGVVVEDDTHVVNGTTALKVTRTTGNNAHVTRDFPDHPVNINAADEVNGVLFYLDEDFAANIEFYVYIGENTSLTGRYYLSSFQCEKAVRGWNVAYRINAGNLQGSGDLPTGFTTLRIYTR